MTFYTTAAQVIPVLAIFLIVERKFFADDAGRPDLDLWVIAVMVLGEEAAFAGLLMKHPGASVRALTGIALAVCGLFLVGPLAAPRVVKMWRSEGNAGSLLWRDRLGAVLWAALIFGTLLAALVGLFVRAAIA